MNQLPYNELLKLKRWNTPTIYNGWEQVTNHDIRKHYNREDLRDFMPQMGPMVGYAVTVVFQPSNKEHAENNPNAWSEYRKYLAGVPGPKIVMVQDLDKPETVGAFWGEVNSNVHKAFGCVGSIIDGALRDVDEMANAGFKCLARRMCISHAYSTPVKWGCEVEVFGCKVQAGQLIHADKHGFIAIPFGDEEKLLQAARFMDDNECNTIIPAARSASGKSHAELLEALEKAGGDFSKAAKETFGGKGEW